MLIRDILRAGKTAVSFEFFPPKTPAGWDRLFRSISELTPLKPAYVSVTYGAGGSTRDKTHDLVTRLHRETDLEVVAHLTCVGHSRDEMKTILDRYAEGGVHNILALRGDDPADGKLPPGDFPYAADLVDFICSTHPQMGVGVAGFPEGHPASLNRLDEIAKLKDKVDAGADYIVTQLFFDNRDYFVLCDRCRLAGIEAPIIAGIMPISSRKNMARMAELAPRTRFPASLIRTVKRADSDKRVEMAGTHWATEQVRDLLDNGVPGIHLYTLNNSASTLRIGESLGLDGFDALL
jgi:methylenetetrahydrofolate reductase (NADPH)